MAFSSSFFSLFMSLVNDYKCIKILVSFFLFTFRLSEHSKVKGKIKKHVA